MPGRVPAHSSLDFARDDPEPVEGSSGRSVMRCFSTLAAACTVLLFAASANADPSTVSRLGWVTNGHVQAAVQVGNTLYIGGAFTRVAPASGALGSLFGISTTTGEPGTVLPLVDGIVNAVEPDGSGGYYIGGAFTTVGGAARPNLAHVLADGSLDPTFVPEVTGGEVLSIALGSSSLFIGGYFTTVDDLPRLGFAAISPATGAIAPLPSTAFANATHAVQVFVAGSNVLIVGAISNERAAGAFDQTSGTAIWSTQIAGNSVQAATVVGSRLIVAGRGLLNDSRSLVSLDMTTGVIDLAWSPSGPLPTSTLDTVRALAVYGTTLYVGGRFSTFGGEPRANAAAVDWTTGILTTWDPNPNAPVSALAVGLGGTIFLGGTFTQVNGQPRETLAEIDAVGTPSAWIGNVYARPVRKLLVDAAGTLVIGAQTGVTGGAARTNLAAFDLSNDTLLPWAPPISDDVTTLAALRNAVYIGASHLVSGLTRVGIVSAVDGISGAALAWTPPASSSGVTLLGTVGQHVYLSGYFSPGGISSVVRVDPTIGTVDPTWRVSVGGEVRRIIVSGSTVYLGGFFGQVQGQRRRHLASVDLATGAVSPWAPTVVPDLPRGFFGRVSDLAVDGRTLYVAYNLGGGSAVVAVDSVSGVQTSGGSAVRIYGADWCGGWSGDRRNQRIRVRAVIARTRHGLSGQWAGSAVEPRLRPHL